MALPSAEIRHQLPILRRRIAGHPLTYLDNAATTQKPYCVLEAIQRYYREQNANAHRGMHVLAEEATDVYEGARKTVQNFLHAEHSEEIVFTKSCTEAINLVAQCFSSYKEGPPNSLSHHSASSSWPRGRGEGRERGSIVLSKLEHHSNIIPWMQRGWRIHWIDIDDDETLQMNELGSILKNHPVDLVSITGQSNVLGIQPDLTRVIAVAHAAGVRVLIDAAQLSAHHPINVQTLDCDFLALSGHKLYGPTGIGVLYGKRELLGKMPPMLGGGGMVNAVNEESFIPLDPPARFEAGTPPVAEAVGLAAAIDWLSGFSWDDIIEHEQRLLAHAEETLSPLPGLTILGKHKRCHTEPVEVRHTSTMVRQAHHDTQCSGCLSFTVDGVHPHDLTDILGREGICLRAGHHCAQPLHRRLGVSASTRLSVSIYNTLEEINRLPEAIVRARHILTGKPIITSHPTSPRLRGAGLTPIT